ncbi:HyfR-type DNA-binding transcriptional activator [Nitrospira sp. KM1]|uniref:sigma 54-interacting transcriptional regulator n=1 Tax=Nitrospira sp. KM1 TaxID=1936990 RepID=UPI0013A71D7A|nr:sigma 54-interacting transcriptional regulator [Nitrospira sp. KM1]BCA54499.1 HyfR-type DNA-binding transcriptional activator [Nitrospira sp. KM1]
MTQGKALVNQHAALLEFAKSIAAHQNISELFQDLANKLPSITGCSAIEIALHDPERNTMRVHSLVSFEPVSLVEHEYPVEDVPGGWVWKHQGPFICHNVALETQFPKMVPKVQRAGVQSFCTVPLTTDRRRLGAMVIAGMVVNHYEQSEVDFLQQVAKHVAIAVEGALHCTSAASAQEAMARERDRLRVLLEINNAVVSHLDLRKLLEEISNCLRRVIPHDVAALALYDPESCQLLAHVLDFPGKQDFAGQGTPIPWEGTPEGLAFTTRQTVLIRKLDITEFDADIVKRAAAEGLRSGCAVPLIARGLPLGTLSVISLREGAFDDEDADLLGRIGVQVAIAVENALNYARARAAEGRFMKERDRLRLLMDVTGNLTSNLQLHDLLHATVAGVRRVMQCDIVTVHLPNAEGTHLRTYALDFPDRQWLAEDALWEPVEGTLHGMVFQSAKPYVAARLDPTRFPTEAAFLATIDIVGGCIVPLIHRGRVLGNLGLGRKQEVPYTEEEVDFLMQFGIQLAIAIDNALTYGQVTGLKDKLTQEKLYLEDEIRIEHNFEEIIGDSSVLQHALRQVEIVAPTDSTVLILGETGTGKELIARAIHNRSQRRERTFVKMNCAAIPTGLLESELFGHERGAFTGAIATKVGRFELANGGTLFLDEVGDIPLELQSKLLRVLQEQEFERLGGTKTIRVNVRLVAATNRNLGQMVAEKDFRSDLYYRLNVFPLSIPPLRERREDIPTLVRYFVQQFARRMNKRIETIPAAAITALSRYSWPGNVRELENLVERAVILSQGSVLAVPLTELESVADGAQPHATLENTEREHILKILKATKWVLSGPTGAAAQLGMKRTTLQSKMQRLRITRPI